jgi:O-antigen ligase
MRRVLLTAAALPVAATAVFSLPGAASPQAFPKWGIFGLCIALLALCEWPHIRKANYGLAPSVRNILLIACVAVFAAVVVPLSFTNSLIAHFAGSLLALQCLAYFFLATLTFTHTGGMGRYYGSTFMLIIGVVCSLPVFLQAFTLIPDAALVSAEVRAGGTFGNPNPAASFFAPIVFLALGLEDDSDDKKKIWISIALILAVATIITLSKAGIMAMIVGGIFYTFFRQKSTALQRLLIITLGVTLFSAIIIFMVTQQWDEFPWIKGRLFLWKAAEMMIIRQPLTGFGFGAFPSIYPTVAAQIINGRPEAFMPLGIIESAHSEPLQFTVELGIPLVLALGFLAFQVSLPLRTGDSLAKGASAGVVTIIFHGLAASTFHFPATCALWWFLAALAITGYSQERAEKSTARLRWLPAFIFTFSVILGIIQATRFFAAEAFWTASLYAPVRGDTQEKALYLTYATWLTPENARLRASYASALRSNGKDLKSLDEINSSLNLCFSFDNAFFRLRLLDEIHYHAEAMSGWLELSHDFPGLLTPHYYLAKTYFNSGQFHDAARELQIVLNSGMETYPIKTLKEKASSMLTRIETFERRQQMNANKINSNR